MYTRGGCFEFYNILRSVFPDAEPFYDHHEGHVYTKIDGKFYDITGQRFHELDRLTPMSSEPNLIGKAHRWMPSANFRVVRLLDE